MRRTKLGECLSVKHGWSFKGEYFAEAGEQCILTPGNFYEKGGFKPNSGRERYYTGKYPKEYLCHKGDLIIAMTQQAEGLLGSTALVPDDNKYLHNQRIGLITCNETKIYPLFAYYLFMTKTVREQLESSASGTKVKHTSPERIYDVIVSIPDLSEQKRIANILMSIEKMINNNIEINDNLMHQLQLYFDYWFNQFEFPDKNGNPYRQSGGLMNADSKSSRIIPCGWRIGSLSEIADIVMGQSPSGDSYNESADGMVFYQGSTDFGDIYPTTRLYTTQPYRMANINDTLLSVRAPVGTINIAFEECCIGRGLSAICGKNGNATFIRYLLKSNSWFFDNINNSGTTFGSITKDVLFEMLVIIPTAEIISKFEDIAALFEGTIHENERQNRELTVIRNWLLPILMNGQATIED